MSAALANAEILDHRALFPLDAERLCGSDFFNVSQHGRPDLIRRSPWICTLYRNAELYNDREAKLCDPDHAVELWTGVWPDAPTHMTGS